MKYGRWIIVAYLLGLMVLSTTILLIPGQKYDTLTTSDSGWVYDIAYEINNTGGMIQRNPLSHAPYGWDVSMDEQLQPLLAVMLYKGVNAVNPSVTLMDVVKYWSPLIFALTLIPIYLIGTELGGKVAGGAAAFFGAAMVSTIYWMKVGAFDREPIQLILTAWTVYFTIKLFKSSKKEMPIFATLAGITFGLFSLAWPGYIFLAAIVIGGLIFVLLVDFFTNLVRKFSDVGGAVVKSIRGSLWLILGVVIMMAATTIITSALGGKNPLLVWTGFAQTMLGYVGISWGGGDGVSLQQYASEAAPAGPLTQTFGTFYVNGVITLFIFIMIVLAMAKFAWTRKRWEVFTFAWLIVLVAMVWEDKGQSRFVRVWWPMVPVLAGAGFATLVSLVRRVSLEPSLSWLKKIQDPLVAIVVMVALLLSFASNAYGVAAATSSPTDWQGGGLDAGLMGAFGWMRENTPKESTVAIEWSYGHLLTGAARRATVTDGVEAVGEQGKWENIHRVKPPDYIYTVKDSSGVFLNEHFSINGRRTDVQRLPGLGSDNEFAFYFETYRDNFGVKIDYFVAHSYQVYSMLDVVLSGGSKRSQSTTADNNLVFNFGDENVIFDGAQMEAYAKGDNGNQYFAGVVILYYNQSESVSNFNYNFRRSPQIPVILTVYWPDPNWAASPTLDQLVAIRGDPYYYGPPLYTRIFGAAAPLPDFMSVAYTSSNGRVKVIKINHAASIVSPADNARINTGVPTFRWSSGIGAMEYEFVLDDDATFSSPISHARFTSLTYTPTVALPDGSYWWRIGAYKGEKFLGWSDASTFVVDTVPPALPQLAEPHDGAELSSLNVAFSWTRAELGAKYQIQIYNKIDLSKPVQDNQVASENFTYTFQNNGAFQWRVRAIDSAGNRSDWSDNFELTVRLPPQAPALGSPPNGAITNDNKFTFSWSGGIADNFRLMVGVDSIFSSPVLDITLGAARSYAMPAALPDDNYSWKVVSIVGARQESSPVWTLVVDTTPPETTNLLKPDNGSSLINAIPTFSWSSAQGAYRYRLVVARDQEFNSPVIDNWVNVTTFTPTVGLSASTYYWKVYTFDEATNFSVSTARAFTIQGG